MLSLVESLTGRRTRGYEREGLDGVIQRSDRDLSLDLGIDPTLPHLAFKRHSLRHALPGRLGDPREKKDWWLILIVRDPFEAVYSETMGDRWLPPTAGFAWGMPRMGRDDWQELASDAMAWPKSAPLLVLHYEDYKSDPEDFITRLGRFLSATDERIKLTIARRDEVTGASLTSLVRDPTTNRETGHYRSLYLDELGASPLPFKRDVWPLVSRYGDVVCRRRE